ncbi:hypothetical protein T459_08727 [Capsicum annuum]|uniref:F-box domain-containing protein n=1 Tax=Capsicum annuum TaxID=4072 RepID=A0A2G2ZXE6_CAPAN|nr:hypothetical protein FXO37_07555 [Capsicum annuum]PHT86621.1 hypothetical protein T459_08727 [Capsicum annuum]
MSEYLIKDVMDQIFSKLPLKSLLRFKCLSKSWDSQISSPEFIWLHTQESVLPKPPTHDIMRYFCTAFKREKIVLTDASGFDTQISLESPFNGRVPDYFYCRIVAICNGVFCVKLFI